MMHVVSNATPIRYLAEIQALHLLPHLDAVTILMGMPMDIISKTQSHKISYLNLVMTLNDDGYWARCPGI